MKRPIYLTALLAVLFVLCSCSNTITEDFSENSDLVSIRTNEEFQALNDSLAATMLPSDTRGFRGFLRFCAVAAADATGAYECGKIGMGIGSLAGPNGAIAGAAIGGVVGGVGGSYAAYQSTRSEGIVPIVTVTSAYIPIVEDLVLVSNHLPRHIELILPSDKAHLKEIGAKHNIALANLIARHMSASAMETVLTPVEVNVLNSSSYKNCYATTLSNINSNIIDNYVEDDGTPINTIMRNLLTILTTSPQNLNDVENILNNYILHIKRNQNISDIERDILYAAICVAASSAEFWSYDHPGLLNR